MKKIISTGVVFIILLTLSISVFADYLPRNDLVGSVELTHIRYRWYDSEEDEEWGNYFYPTSANHFEFGKLYNCEFYCYTPFVSNDSYFFAFNMRFDWTLTLNDTCTIYLPYYTDNSSSIIESVYFGTLAQYRNPDKDFTINASFHKQYTYDVRFLDISNIFEPSATYTESNEPLSRDITFYCFDNVPAGSYNIIIYTYDDLDSTTSPISFNFYMSPFVSIPTLFEDFENGDVSFNEAMNDIQNNLDNVINSNVSDTEKLVAIGVAQNDIERIKQISDVKYNGVVNDFISDADSIIDSYNNGTIDVNTAISDIQMIYFDSLSQSVTSEQGVYINTANQIKLAELQLNWHSNYKVELDSVITDEDLENKDIAHTELDGYLDKEHEVLEIFEEAEISSYLQFSEYLNNLKGSDVTGIKSIYNFFLTKDSNSLYYNFITVPFALGVFALLLSTSLVVPRGRKDG